jgi:F-type H+-transporting ATPase subunit gamma
MAVAAKAIKQKIKGVGNIRKITRTMEMVSVSKMKKAISAATMVKAYTATALEVLSHISAKTNSEHIYFKQQTKEETKVDTKEGNKEQVSNTELIIIVSSNKGLCGSYNTNIYRKLSQIVKANTGTGAATNTIELITIGKQAEKIAKRTGLGVHASFTTIPDSPSLADATAILRAALAYYSQQKPKSISIVYTHFIKQMQYKVMQLPLLPLSASSMLENTEAAGAEPGSGKETLFEPSQSIIIDEMVPRLLTATIYGALCDAAASEHSTRMFAMKTASDNAKEMQRILTISYNRARQDAVTQELAEIAAGAGAVAG